MDLQRMLRDVRELSRAMADPELAPPDDELDGYELTVSARDFTKATRKVVDEKLTFSAALMRAGEVQEASRILAEVEHDVRNEEAVLLEKVNEVKAKRAVKRAHITRLRLVRLLATAMVGAGLLGVSAMGMAVAGMFEKGSQRGGQHGRGHVKFADARGANKAQKKKVMLGEVALKLNKQDLRTLRELTSGSVNATVLERFLEGDLDLPPSLVEEALASVLSLTDPVVAAVEQVVDNKAAPVDEVVVVDEAKKKAKAEEDADPEPEPSEPAEEPADEKEPSNGGGGGGDPDDEDGKGRDGDGDAGGDPLEGLSGF